MTSPTEQEKNTLRKRAKRYAKVAGAAAKVGAGVAGSRLRGAIKSKNKKKKTKVSETVDAARDDTGRAREAALLRAALGGLKGPLMKVAQLMASIPDFLPREYAAELMTLQADAPSMGWPFVRRRMVAELGADWPKKFKSFEQTAAAAASLGQVHRAASHDGRPLACKLQYPDMESVVEADLRQLKIMLGLFSRFDTAVSTGEVYGEIADRLREELDYGREARNMALYREMLKGVPEARVPEALPELSTDRLLTMTWLEGERLADAAAHKSQGERNALATTMFRIWYAPFYQYGVIHGDPHLGNYSVRDDDSVNLLDFGCVRVFRPELVQAVIQLFFALRDNKPEQAVEAYRLWGFVHPSHELVEILNIWARFVYAPFMKDRVCGIEETNATATGRAAAAKVHRELRKLGGVAIPPEFVMIDRASIGLGGVFLRLGAKLNWHKLFCELTADFDVAAVAVRQKAALEKVGLG